MSISWGFCIRPFLGQVVAGDAAVVRLTGDHHLFAIIDGLGHGPLAHAAASQATQFLLNHERVTKVSDALLGLHQSLRTTRGAAIGICCIISETGDLVYAGIGNTVCRQFGKTERRFVSRDGTVGQVMPEPFLQRVLLAPGDAIVMHTDGIRATVDARDYSGIMRADPSAAARNIIQKFGKSTDDAGCLVIKYAHD